MTESSGTHRIVFSGISGLGKTAILKRLRNSLIQGRGLDISNARALVPIVPAEISIPIAKFLEDLPRGQIEALHKSYDKAAKLIEQAEKKSPLAIFVPAHFTFVDSDRAFSPLSLPRPKTPEKFSLLIDFLQRVHPTHVVNLIDDVQYIQHRIATGPNRLKLRLREILKWREFETNISDYAANCIIAPSSRCEDFDTYPYERSPVFAIRHRSETLLKYLFESNVPRLYASFPISKVVQNTDPKTRKQQVQELDHFLNTLSDHFVIFNPLTIDEKPLELEFDRIASLSSSNGTPKRKAIALPPSLRWPIAGAEILSPHPITKIPDVAFEELQEVGTRYGDPKRSIISRQIELRDYRLIDQADGMIIYRPTSKRSGEWSGGTRAEFDHGRAMQQIRPSFHIYIVRDPQNDGELGPEVQSADGKTFQAGSRRIRIVDTHANLHLVPQRAKAISELVALITQDQPDLTQDRHAGNEADVV